MSREASIKNVKSNIIFDLTEMKLIKVGCVLVGKDDHYNERLVEQVSKSRVFKKVWGCGCWL